jgi:hypothetical protein
MLVLTQFTWLPYSSDIMACGCVCQSIDHPDGMKRSADVVSRMREVHKSVR